MHVRIISRAIGGLLALLSFTTTIPLATAWHFNEDCQPWLMAMGLGLSIAAGLWLLGRHAGRDDLGLREGLAITCLAWVACSMAAAIGPWLDVPGLSYLDAWFEMLSGLTTTGASIFGGHVDVHGNLVGTTIGELGHATLIWRATVQLIGGVGIVVLSLALLPLLSSGSGYQLYRSEVTGINADRLAPRIIDTARLLVGCYLLLAAISVGLLLLVGVDPFTAFCHAITAISTGGFSTFDNSVSGLHNRAAEWVLIATMFIGGINFALLIAAVRGNSARLLRSEEARTYVAVVITAWMALLIILAGKNSFYSGRTGDLVRDSLFQVVSICTSTGFASGFDASFNSWEGWPQAAQFLLLLLMIGGACAGSTSGGVKLVRLVLLTKLLRRETRRHGEPHRITPVTLDAIAIGDAQLLHAAGLVFAFGLFLILGALLLTLMGLPIAEAFSGALTCLTNNGPGIRTIGVAHNFGALPDSAKLTCMVLMLLGRLEFFGVLMTCSYRHWR